jgi:hypothetical protein
MKLIDDIIMVTIIMTMAIIINDIYVWCRWDLSGSGMGPMADKVKNCRFEMKQVIS